MLTKLYSIILILSLLQIKYASAQELKTKLIQKYQNEVSTDDGLNIFTIQSIVNILLKKNEDLKAALLQIDALEKSKLQQTRMPNPELGIEAENFLGSKDFNGFKGSELTAMISQEILLAGKISKRVKVAEYQKEAANYDYESKRLELITEARLLLNEICSEEKRLLKQNELLLNSREFLNDIKIRNKKGQISEVEVTRASIIQNKIEIEIQNTTSKIEKKINALASLLNYDIPEKTEFQEENISLDELPAIDKLTSLIEENPIISKQRIIEMRDQSQIEYEKSKGVPNLTIGAGIRRINETNDNALVLGVSLPIPIFDSNEDGIEESIIRMDQNRASLLAMKIKLSSELKSHYQQAQNTKKNLSVYKTDLIPKTIEALAQIEEGNKMGRYGILDVLDLRRTLFELEMEYLDLDREYKSEIINIENLIAQNLQSAN